MDKKQQLTLQIFENFVKDYSPVDPNSTLEEIRQRQLPKISFDDATKRIIDEVNEVLSTELAVEDKSVEDLHQLIYCGAQTVVELCKRNNITIYPQEKLPKILPQDKNNQTELFKMSPRRFSRLLFQKSIIIEQDGAPAIKDIEDFWSNLWKKTSDVDAEKTAEYVNSEKERVGQKSMIYEKITASDLKKALKVKKNWSPAGIDGVQTFWYKKFKSIQKALLKKINNIIDGEESMPNFFTVGLTELSPKSGDTEDPSKYRPITHLPAIYKIITRCVYDKIYEHYEKEGILADEQCGGRKDCYGVRKAVMIDSVALEHGPLSGYYVDFKKAFDSVSHKWVLQLLEVYQVHEKLVKFLSNAMLEWKTRIYLDVEPKMLTKSISFERGVFQGDSTSVLLFWTAINPLSFAINRENLGLQIDGKTIMSHLLYMDDLKLYATKEEDLRKIYQIVDTFSKAISMEINDEKSKQFTIPSSNDNSSQMYLGYVQSPKIDDHLSKQRKIKNFETTSKKIKNALIDDDHKAKLKKMYQYNSIFNSFGVLHWSSFKGELLDLDVRYIAFDSIDKKIRLQKIYYKLFSEMYKMRRTFQNQDKNKKDKLLANIIKIDTITPLRLSQLDNDYQQYWISRHLP